MSSIFNLHRAETFASICSTDKIVQLIQDFKLNEDQSLKFTHYLTWDDFSGSEKELWTEFLGILGLKPEQVPNFGSITYESYAVKWYNSPVVAKDDETGELFLYIGSSVGEIKALALPVKIDNEKWVIVTANGKKTINAYFGKGDYPNPDNPNERIDFPLFVVSAGKGERDKYPNIFNVRVNVRQKPQDQKDIKEGVEYYNHLLFESATRECDGEVVAKYIQPLLNFKPSAPLSTLFSDMIIAKEFPTQGISIPIIGVRAVPGEFGVSYSVDVDLSNAWICGMKSHTPLGEFTTYFGSKKKGTAQQVPSKVVDSIYIGSSQAGAKQIATLLESGKTPSKTEPWILWVKSPNVTRKGAIQPDFVPDHNIFSFIPPIPTLKACAPSALLPPAK